MLKTNQKGQSLIEMMVALFILVAALTATIVLIVTSINAGRQSINKLIATSLAREGIEVVRNIRDSNWIDPNDSAPDWDDGLVDTTSTAIPVIDGSGVIALNFDVNDFTVIKLSDNQYVQDTTAGTDTQFYRLLYINPICHDDAETEKIADKESTDSCGSGDYNGYDNKVGIRVISEVRWPSPDGRKVIIEDRLYNWQVL